MDSGKDDENINPGKGQRATMKSFHLSSKTNQVSFPSALCSTAATKRKTICCSLSATKGNHLSIATLTIDVTGAT